MTLKKKKPTVPAKPKRPRVPHTKEEVNRLIASLDFYRPAISAIVDAIPPFDLTVACAYLLSAIETQLPEAKQGFNEMRKTFGMLYPVIMAADRMAHPDDEIPADSILITIPAPIPGTQSLSQEDKPVLVGPRGERVN